MLACLKKTPALLQFVIFQWIFLTVFLHPNFFRIKKLFFNLKLRNVFFFYRKKVLKVLKLVEKTLDK